MTLPVVDPLEELLTLAAQLEQAKATRRLFDYQPYPFQKRFHHAEGYQTPGVLARDRAMIAANKVGKTFAAAAEIAMHATGIYPEWWEGHRFRYAVDILCASNTFEQTRDIQQAELFGKPEDDAMLGTGTVPRDNIGKVTKKLGVQNAFESVQIKHKSGGWSTIQFKAYEQGFKKFMGKGWRVIWPDEEPPRDVLSQMNRAMFALVDGILMCTFTPEEGMTDVVSGYFNNLQKGQALITATWDDAPHMTPEVRAEKLAAIPAHEREMRSKGMPISGAGLIFPVEDDRIVVDPFEIPRHWPRVNGVDFGWDHPFAAGALAWDRDADCIYLTHEYRESKALPAIHAQALHAWGEWIPVAWPHDGLNTEKGTGDELVKQYRDVGVNMLPWKATNPPGPGENEGEGGVSVEAALLDMLTRMETGRFKVFRNCTMFLEEKRMYHRKNGKIVKIMDDLISAVRYGCMMIRHARLKPVQTPGHMATNRNGVTYLSAAPRRRL